MSQGNGSLIVKQLSKQYAGGALANDGLDLEVGTGEVFGLLGPNGAGKTTLVKQIIGLLKPTAGTVSLGGRDLVADPSLARELCSYLPQGALPTAAFRVREVIEMVGRIRGGDAAGVRQRTDRLIEALELGQWRNSFGLSLSGGVRRLVGFAMTAVWPTPLVILDEPTNDVDPLRRRLLWKQIRGLGRQGTTVLLVTHNVLEAEQSVDRLAVIDRGRIVAQGTPSSLKAEDRGTLRLQLQLVPGAELPEPPAFALEHLRLGRFWNLWVREDSATEAIPWARTQVEAGIAEEYALGAATLEDAYIRLIGRADALEARNGREGR